MGLLIFGTIKYIVPRFTEKKPSKKLEILLEEDEVEIKTEEEEEQKVEEK